MFSNTLPFIEDYVTELSASLSQIFPARDNRMEFLHTQKIFLFLCLEEPPKRENLLKTGKSR